MSHPAWDAWIEIIEYESLNKVLASRIPHGMRGLKLSGMLYDSISKRSHPAWDAWIEIQRGRVWQAGREVASRMGCVDLN